MVPPALSAIIQLREYQRYTRHDAVDNIICSTDILWHYGHFAQDVSYAQPTCRFSKSSLLCKVNNNFKEKQTQLPNYSPYSHLFHIQYIQLKTKNIVNWEKFRPLSYRLNPYLRSLLANASFPPSSISQTCSLIPILCNNGIVKS